MHDLFVSDWQDGAWQPARPLSGKVNSPAEDFDAALPEGDTMLVFTRKQERQEGADLYVSFLAGGAWGEPVRLGPEVNADAAWSDTSEAGCSGPAHLLEASIAERTTSPRLWRPPPASSAAGRPGRGVSALGAVDLPRGRT